jgi:hypothetical protein
MWYYIPVKIATVTFSVWRKTGINMYKVVGTNTIVVKGKVNMTIYPAIITSAE